MIRTLAAQLIFYLHLACVVFLVLGCFLPKAFLPYHMAFIPAVIVQWWFNSNQCVLTQIQHKLEGKTINRDEEGQFIKELFGKLGFEPSRAQLYLIIYGLLTLNFCVSFYRWMI